MRRTKKESRIKHVPVISFLVRVPVLSEHRIVSEAASSDAPKLQITINKYAIVSYARGEGFTAQSEEAYRVTITPFETSSWEPNAILLICIGTRAIGMEVTTSTTRSQKNSVQ
jgi:hypothetical protein